LIVGFPHNFPHSKMKVQQQMPLKNEEATTQEKLSTGKAET
jgi:hypothetical protein